MKLVDANAYSPYRNLFPNTMNHFTMVPGNLTSVEIVREIVDAVKKTGCSYSHRTSYTYSGSKHSWTVRCIPTSSGFEPQIIRECDVKHFEGSAPEALELVEVIATELANWSASQRKAQ